VVVTSSCFCCVSLALDRAKPSSRWAWLAAALAVSWLAVASFRTQHHLHHQRHTSSRPSRNDGGHRKRPWGSGVSVRQKQQPAATSLSFSKLIWASFFYRPDSAAAAVATAGRSTYACSSKLSSGQSCCLQSETTFRPAASKSHRLYSSFLQRDGVVGEARS